MPDSYSHHTQPYRPGAATRVLDGGGGSQTKFFYSSPCQEHDQGCFFPAAERCQGDATNVGETGNSPVERAMKRLECHINTPTAYFS